MTRLLPIDEISLTIIVWAPCPMAITAITAAMPTIMPMQVSIERVLFLAIALAATLKIIAKFTRAPP